MPSRLLNRVQRQLLISLLLVTVGVRALIPAGFMPSADRPFTLEICPDGFPAQLLHNAPSLGPHAGHGMHDGMHGGIAMPDDASDQQGGHEQSSMRAEHCVFAAIASIGPPPHISLLLTPFAALAALQSESYHPVIELTRYRVQQPRGPPHFS